MAGKRRAKHAEHENLERWLLTYADMITLLMAFFVMLYGMSQLDIKKFQAMVGSVRAELGGSGVLAGGSGLSRGSGQALTQTGIGFAPRPAPEVVGQLGQDIREAVQVMPDHAGIEVVSSTDRIVVRIPADRLHFTGGSATLTPAMRQTLLRLGRIARRGACSVKAEGHTCNLPVQSGEYPSNWELSADRAQNAAIFLVRKAGLSPADVSSMGYAHTRPLKPNTSAANRARNRRVEFSLQPGASHVEPVAAGAGSTQAAGTQGPLPISIAPAPVDLRPGLAPEAQ